MRTAYDASGKRVAPPFPPPPSHDFPASSWALTSADQALHTSLVPEQRRPRPTETQRGGHRRRAAAVRRWRSSCAHRLKNPVLPFSSHMHVSSSGQNIIDIIDSERLESQNGAPCSPDRACSNEGSQVLARRFRALVRNCKPCKACCTCTRKASSAAAVPAHSTRCRIRVASCGGSSMPS